MPTTKRVQAITHLLITGSTRAASAAQRAQMLDYARRAVQRAQRRGFTVLVGDSGHGIDRAVVEECRRLRVPVIVAGTGNRPRNGGCRHGSYVKVDRALYRGMGGRLLDRDTVRDRWLLDTAQMGLFIGYGDEAALAESLAYMQSRRKVCWLRDMSGEVRHG